MEGYRGGKRSSISFGTYHRQNNGGNGYLKNGNGAESSGYAFNNGSMNNENNYGGGGPSYGGPRSNMYSPLNFSQNMLQNSYSQQSNYRANSMVSGNGTMACEYQSARPLFALDWSVEDLVALGSYREDSLNKLQIIQSNDLLSWDMVLETNVTYPISKIQWLPSQPPPRKLATSSDSLRIWSIPDGDNKIIEEINLSLCKYNEQNYSNVKTAYMNDGGPGEDNGVQTRDKNEDRILGQLPPVTSFDWNSLDSNILISSSIDTTCIVWDLQSSTYVKTQLIAHDSEVFDVRFLAQSTQLFSSCGGDGSVRVFDLRSLAHSTIIYEYNPDSISPNKPRSHSANSSNALLRLEPSPADPNVMATFAADSNAILILDIRNPGVPVLVLEGHSAPVNQIKWHPTRPNIILSCGDDCQILCWDLNDNLNEQKSALQGDTSQINSTNIAISENQVETDSQWNQANIVKTLDVPSMCYSYRQQEFNNIVWRPQISDWFGCVSGRRFNNVKVNF